MGKNIAELFRYYGELVKWLRRWTFTPETRIQFPYSLLIQYNYWIYTPNLGSDELHASSLLLFKKKGEDMKYLSEDGKVFLYEEECLAHERSVKEDEQKKAEREEKRKAKEKLDKQFEYLVENIDLWLKNSIEFQNKYGKDEDEIKNAKDVDKFLDFLMDCFD